MALLDIDNLSLYLQEKERSIAVVEGLSLSVQAGHITCLVGESGCGKSLSMRAILGLLPTGFSTQGHIKFEGKNLSALSEREWQKLRGQDMAMIFQEPMTALNPVLTVGYQTAEPLIQHLGMSRRAAHQRVLELFSQVGIAAPEIRAMEYPHQLSGGMRQRIMIAMALSCQPRLLLADEPTTALDVSIQGQILHLLCRLTEERHMGLLLITHDLGVIAHIADYIGVMYAGRLVEYASRRQLLQKPLHPYTQGLIACTPTLLTHPPHILPTIEGTVPPPGSVQCGCVFRARCAKAQDICSQHSPQLSQGEHRVACWLA